MSTNIEVQNLAAQQNEQLVSAQEPTGRFRKIIGRAVLVAGLLAGGVTAGVAVDAEPAAAETGGYPDADAQLHRIDRYDWWKDENGNGRKDITDDNLYDNDETMSIRGYGYNNCTDWAAWRGTQLSGVQVPGGLGNANTWDDRAPAYGFKVDQSPEVGDIAVWNSGSYGHVEVVEKVHSNGSVDTSGYNLNADGSFNRQYGVRAEAYVDLNGTGVGGNGTPISDGGSAGEPNIPGLNDVLDTTGDPSLGWRTSINGKSAWQYDYLDSTRMKSTLLLGDFDRDGRVDDLVDTTGDPKLGWRMSITGKEGWHYDYLDSTRVAASLLVGDFDRDGFQDDILDATADPSLGWRVSINGKEGWNYKYLNSSRSKSSLIVGDFDNDGFIDDVLDTTGDSSLGWRVSEGGSEGWSYSYQKSSRKADSLLLGDFDNDGYMDDLLDAGSQYGWRVSYGGKTGWDHAYRDSTMPASELAVGDFDNDGFNDDVFNAGGPGVGWRVSIDGKGSWQQLNSSSRTMGSLIIGDFSRL